jgi:glyoxylase-like metal-dependent hydrolase (beta-lactamase superfamily II)
VLLKQVVPSVYAIQLGVVNAFLIEGHDLTLVDTGSPGSAPQIVKAVESLGRSPRDIRHILVTHSHPDHAGGLAELKRITGAAAYMHPLAAEVVRGEEPSRCVQSAPGAVNRILHRIFIPKPPWRIPPALVEHEVYDGDVLDCTGHIEAIHIPGHCAGQLAFVYHYRPNNGALLFVADAASNMRGLGLSLVYEDIQCGLRSLAKLAGMRFEVACFGHGDSIVGKASERFKAKWGAEQVAPAND